MSDSCHFKVVQKHGMMRRSAHNRMNSWNQELAGARLLVLICIRCHKKSQEILDFLGITL